MISPLKKHRERSKKTLFVLDDWPDVIKLFELAGIKNNMNVIGATTNQDARVKFDRLGSHKAIQVAFIDVEIGTDSGLEVFAYIRTKMPKLPVVIMTGKPDNKSLVQLIAGDPYTSFLSKPFFMEEITEIIHEPLSKAGDIRELVELAMFIEETNLL